MGTGESFELRLDEYQRALEALREVLALEENDVVRDATIQRFEFTFELAWRSMMFWLRDRGIDVRNPRDTLREAFRQGLIEDAASWTDLQKNRNLTSHTYKRELAERVYAEIRAYAVPLFAAALDAMKQ